MFARTERLMLRPGWKEDAPALAAAIGDLGVARNLARVPHPYRLSDAETFLTLPAEGALPRLLVYLRTAGPPRLVGGVGLHACEASGEAELGYWIARPYWGLGFATEAGRAVVAMARDALRLPRLVAGHALDNPASGRVLRKLGFAATGAVTPRQSLARGGAMHCADFSLELATPPAVRLAA